MCSLAPICYASQITQGQLHAARPTTCLSRVSLPLARLSLFLWLAVPPSWYAFPGEQIDQDEIPRSFRGPHKRQVRSLLDATQTHEAIGSVRLSAMGA